MEMIIRTHPKYIPQICETQYSLVPLQEFGETPGDCQMPFELAWN